MGLRRPVTPFITQFVCRGAFVVLGMRFTTQGQPLQGAGAVVANHASWLDIFALNARKRIYFVSKSEVAGWPGIGWLARATGTVFIKRDRSAVQSQIDVFRDRLAAGHKLLFFPEGTSTDGLQVLAFKPALFAAFFDPAFARHAANAASVRDLLRTCGHGSTVLWLVGGYGFWTASDVHTCRRLARRACMWFIIHQ